MQDDPGPRSAGSRPRRPLAKLAPLVLLAGTTLALTACASPAQLPQSAGEGPNPQLPPPTTGLVPTFNVARAVGWPDGARPTPAPDLAVAPFARGLDHPRWLLVLPNGDVLVAETNAPPRPPRGLRERIARWVMGRAGAGAASADRITLLRDVDGDGIAEIRSVLIEHLASPFGMALVGARLYVANADAVVRLPWHEGKLQISARPEKLIDLPAGINHHWTKNLLASRDGSKLFVTVGSNSNIGENGLDNEIDRAAIWEVDLSSGQHRIFASGLRNPNGLAIEPRRGLLWTVVNERDELGSDLVPDYLTSVTDGAFYGWPWSYFGQHVDERVQPPRPEQVAGALIPDYALGTHTAALGLTTSEGNRLPVRFAEGMFIGRHGSWNREPRAGYDVVFVPFSDGRPSGLPLPVLTGFVDEQGQARGRPVGVAIDGRGGLLVADDVGNTVWRVTAVTAPASREDRGSARHEALDDRVSDRADPVPEVPRQY